MRLNRSCLGTATLLVALSIPAFAGDASIPLLVTVDDLPIASELHVDPRERLAITRDLLETLERHGVPAVGFVTWRNVKDDTDIDLLRMWLDAGHELGNHSDQHLNYSATDVEEYIADVERARVRLAQLLAERGSSVRFFRFPFLREGDTMEKLSAMRAYLDQSGQRNVPVTIDNQDWSFERPWVEASRAGDERAAARVGAEYLAAVRLAVAHHERTSRRLFERDVPQILLLHANAVGAANWDGLFTELTENGHRFAKADEVLADSALLVEHDYVGSYGPSRWDRLLDRNRRRDALREVERLLAEQMDAWNHGDLEAFCSHYATDATFLAPSGLSHGRQFILDRYRERYPDRAAMGTLSIDMLEAKPAAGTEVSMMGDARPSRVHGMSVAARWTLDYEGGESKSGTTLLVLHRTGRGWEIVQDASM